MSNLITDEEAKEMQKMHAFKDEPTEHELLASVFERTEAYMGDAGKSSKQRRQVRKARRAIQYHIEMQSILRG